MLHILFAASSFSVFLFHICVLSLKVVLFSLSFFFSFFLFFFLGLHAWCMEVPRLGVKSEL